MRWQALLQATDELVSVQETSMQDSSDLHDTACAFLLALDGD